MILIELRKRHIGLRRKIKSIKFVLQLAVLSIVMVGCTRNKLALIERMVESDINIADSLIYSMKEPKVKHNRAIHAIYKTQIDYKQYRQIPDDSIIRIATDYYGDLNKNYYAAMAWYSLGCISAEAGLDSTAADAYLTAIRLFPDTLERYYALAEQNLSYIYLNHGLYSEAIPLIRACRNNAIRLNDSAAIAFCDYNIATYYLYSNDYRTAGILFHNLIDNKWLSYDTKDMPLLQLSKINLINKNYSDAIKYTDMFISKNCNSISNCTAYSIKADALYNLDKIDSAYLYYTLSLNDNHDPYTRCDTYRRLSEIHSLKANVDSATYYAKKANAWMDTIVSSSNSEIILRALMNNPQYSNITINKHNHFIIIILITLIILVIGISLKYNKKTHEELRSLADYAPDFEAFKNSELFYKMVNIIHQKKELTAKERKEIEYSLQESLSEVRNYIISTSPKLTSMEIDFCIFSIIGFKQKDFHLFYNISYSGSRKFKARIKERIDINLYNEIFCNTPFKY